MNVSSGSDCDCRSDLTITTYRAQTHYLRPFFLFSVAGKYILRPPVPRLALGPVVPAYSRCYRLPRLPPLEAAQRISADGSALNLRSQSCGFPMVAPRPIQSKPTWAA